MKDSIEEMLQRWEEEPTPQLSLQLAEEYRQQGQLEEGTTILEQALRLHPHHVSARVAYGRFLLDLGRSEEAAQMLEAVVEEDPTHLVANKLLIGLYLQTDRVKEARDRLDLYKLLNESDPEIELLEERLAPVGAAAVQPIAVDAAGRVFVLPDSPQPPDLRGLAAGAGQAGGFELRPRVPASEGPFGDLWRGVDQEGYERALGAEGIFPVVVAVEVERPAEASVELIGEVPQLPIEAVPEAEPVAEELEGEGVELESVVESGEEAPDQQIGATATLAKLYLDQGHLEDAAQAFEEVLAREPDHVDAQEGLAEARRRMGESTSAEGPLEGDAEDDIRDARDRKVQVLREYLSRLRAATGRQ